jgi:hypothetical protein
MANINAPFGFRQFSGLGSAPTYEQVAVAINYNAPAIFYGDPVTPQADGSVAQSVTSGATPAATGIAGIFQGCKYLSVSQKRTVWSNYWPGSDVASGNTVEGYIVNDPNSLFVVQTDATGLALVDVNSTLGFVIGVGNTANGISGAYLSAANGNVANNPFRVVSIINFPPGVQGTLSSGQPYDWAVVAFSNVNTKNFTGI